jgi:hypothetical protein
MNEPTYLGTKVYENGRNFAHEIGEIIRSGKDGFITRAVAKERIKAILMKDAEMLEPESEESKFLERLMK